MCSGVEIGAWLAETFAVEGAAAVTADSVLASGIGVGAGEVGLGAAATAAGAAGTTAAAVAADAALGELGINTAGMTTAELTASGAGLTAEAGAGLSAEAARASAALGELGINTEAMTEAELLASGAGADATAASAAALTAAELAQTASLGKTALDTLKEYAPLLSAGATLLGSAAALNAAKSPNAAGTGTTLTASSKDATQAEVSPSGLPAGGPPASTTSKMAQDPRSPSALDLARRRKLAALGGEGSTLLTGGDGIDSGSLSVGKATLLGQ